MMMGTRFARVLASILVLSVAISFMSSPAVQAAFIAGVFAGGLLMAILSYKE